MRAITVTFISTTEEKPFLLGLIVTGEEEALRVKEEEPRKEEVVFVVETLSWDLVGIEGEEGFGEGLAVGLDEEMPLIICWSQERESPLSSFPP